MTAPSFSCLVPPPHTYRDEAATLLTEGQLLMKTDEMAALPLLDLSVLERLRTKADDGEWIWKVFVRNFVTGLPHTIERLRLALTTGDLTGALSAALSLKSSS